MWRIDDIAAHLGQVWNQLTKIVFRTPRIACERGDFFWGDLVPLEIEIQAEPGNFEEIAVWIDVMVLCWSTGTPSDWMS
jgi:hypothetical protein